MRDPARSVRPKPDAGPARMWAALVQQSQPRLPTRVRETAHSRFAGTVDRFSIPAEISHVGMTGGGLDCLAESSGRAVLARRALLTRVRRRSSIGSPSCVHGPQRSAVRQARAPAIAGVERRRSWCGRRLKSEGMLPRSSSFDHPFLSGRAKGGSPSTAFGTRPGRQAGFVGGLRRVDRRRVFEPRSVVAMADYDRVVRDSTLAV